MDSVLEILFNLSIAFVTIYACYLYNISVIDILDKDRNWYKSFLKWIAVLILETLLFSWLPGRMNLEFSLGEGLMVFEDGMIFHNLSFILFSQVIGIGIALATFLWRCIRKKCKFSGKFVALEILIAVILTAIAIPLFSSEYKIEYGPEGTALAKIIYFLMAVAGLGVFIWLCYSDKAKKEQAAAEKDHTSAEKEQTTIEQKTPPKSAGSSTAPSADAIRQYEAVVAEKNRLAQAGDYSAQIMLLTKALGLPLDNVRKATLWNYLGLANEKIDALKRSEECYQTALKTDPDNPAALNNLALLYSAAGNHSAAQRDMGNALQQAKARKYNLGVYYGNCALIEGRCGNKGMAAEMLGLAEKVGYDAASVASLRRQIGL